MQHQPEEVWLVVDGLVRDHHRSLAHHPLLDLGGDLVESFAKLGTVPGNLPQTGRNVPEAHVGALGILDDHLEAGPRLNTIGEIFRILKHFVDVLLETGSALGAPHEPELEDVGAAATLDVLVAGVVLGVVELVLLEQVGRVGRVTPGQDALVAGQEGRTLLGCGQQLVGIPGDGIRPRTREREGERNAN